MKITEMEQRVLTALYESSEGNGHDFGLVQECRGAVEQPRQLAGIMSSLSQKGLFQIHDDVITDSGTWTQTTWLVPVEEIEALINAVRPMKAGVSVVKMETTGKRYRIQFEHEKTGIIADLYVRANNIKDAKTKASETMTGDWNVTFAVEAY